MRRRDEGNKKANNGAEVRRDGRPRGIGRVAFEAARNDTRRNETIRRDGEVREMRLEEGEEVLKRTHIEGDAISFFPDKEMRRMTPRDYLERGLAPGYQTEVEGVKFSFSHAVHFGGHDAVVSYVQMPGEQVVTARGYYRSGSAGVWRYLPDYKMHEPGKVLWYGKGSNEEQLTLPTELQAALDDVVEMSWGLRESTNPAATVNAIRQEGNDWRKRNPFVEEAFFGTARRISEGKYYTGMRERGVIRDALGVEVNPRPILEYDADFRTGGVPEQMAIGGALGVDFKHEKKRFRMRTPIQGNVTGREYPSRDGGLNYLFLEMEDGRASLASIQLNGSPITSTGLRRDWVRGGDLVTPLYEYRTQTSGMGDESDVRGRYVGMWRNCVSRFPIIKEYKLKRRR